MNKSAKINDSKGDRLFNTIVNIIATVVLLFALYPIIYVISSSFSDPHSLLTGKVWLWPVNFSLAGYKAVFTYEKLWIGFFNSVYITVVATVLNLFMTVIAAYPLSRKDLKLRTPILMMFTFTMLFSGGLIPNYLLIMRLGLLNTRLALIIPGALSIFNFMVTKTFFETTIPSELLESAKLDGCSDIKFILSIVIPLSGAILAVMALYYSVSHWNAYFNAMIYINDPKKQTLQVILREILILNSTEEMTEGMAKTEAMYLAEQLKYGLIVVASLPLMIAYPFVQKYFVKGVMIGAVKG